MNRKIVQLVPGSSSSNYAVLYALCDDGTIWRFNGTEWFIEKNIPKNYEETWPSELVARIAKVDLAAATWLRDNWVDLVRRREPRIEIVDVKNICDLMPWVDTPQGYDYWLDIARKL